MRYLTGATVKDRIDGIVHTATQQHDYETDLTVTAIYEIVGPGEIDFGGSEFKPAERTELAPVKRDHDDQYGWWELPPGTYVVRYNEVPDLRDDLLAFVQPHERLQQAGATHPTFWFRDTREHVETLLNVGDGGINIKQNARLSKLLILTLDD